MASNFSFLSDQKFRQQAELLEAALRCDRDCSFAAQSLRPFLEGYIRKYQLQGKKFGGGLSSLLKHLQRKRPHFSKPVWNLMNDAAHGSVDKCSSQEIIQALASIHGYMRAYPPDSKAIPVFNRDLYMEDKAKQITSKPAVEQENKALDVRPLQLPKLSDARVRAFESLRDAAQMEKLAKFFDREGLREKVNQELEGLLKQIGQDCEENFPHAEEQHNLQYYARLNATEFIEELYLEGKQSETWRQLPVEAKKTWQAELVQWHSKWQESLKKRQKNQQSQQLEQKPNFAKLLGQVAKHKRQSLQNYILQKWFQQFVHKRDRWLQKIIDEAREKYLAQLQQQMEQFKKLKEILAPFGSGFGRLWDMSKGDLRHIDWNVLKHYEQLLEREESLKELATLLGRYRKAENSYEKKLLEINEEILVQKALHGQGGQRIGLEYGNKLNRIVPKELLPLADEESELLFLLKYSQKRLLQYKTTLPIFVADKITLYKEEKHAQESDQGPFILCIDTSGSMPGLPEQMAKMLCYVLARFAAQTKRKLFLINFSAGVECLDLSHISQSVKALSDFLCMSFHGGTDITPAMRKAVAVMAQKDYQKADLLLISDGLFPSVSAEDILLVEQQKKKESRFYSLIIGSSVSSDSLHIFDENWIYNLGESYESLVEKLRFSLGKVTLRQ